VRVTRFLAFAAAVHLTTSCDGTPAIADRAPPVVATLGATDPECLMGDAHPTTGAPAEGLWLYEDGAAQHRVAAIVGPAQSAAGQSQVTRRVETLEAIAGADTIRFSSDTASVRLEFIPPFARPAAVYSIGPQVRLASYEPCGAGQRQPLIRYLREDDAGRVATDVLLQREAQP
jgi:hypothetical protein